MYCWSEESLTKEKKKKKKKKKKQKKAKSAYKDNRNIAMTRGK
jgi:hypothetical protein